MKSTFLEILINFLFIPLKASLKHKNIFLDTSFKIQDVNSELSLKLNEALL